MRLQWFAFICLALVTVVQPGFAQDKSAYMKECEEKGVPLPPKWGDPEWRKLKTNLPADSTFDTGGITYLRTEVWVYSTDNGVCMALPRIDSGGISLLGMICQGKSGNACFWDNIPLGGTEKDRIKGDKTKGMDPAKLQGGNELKEACDECHRGRNAFVVHPGTPLDPKTWADIGFEEPPAKAGEKKESKTVAKPPTVPPLPDDQWYQPVSNQGWKNPKGKVDLPGCSNGACHQLPELTRPYCSLLAKEIGKTMPAADKDMKIKKGDWRDGFRDDVKTLAEACKELGYGTPEPPFPK
jgi:hypothetical protein